MSQHLKRKKKKKIEPLDTEARLPFEGKICHVNTRSVLSNLKLITSPDRPIHSRSLAALADLQLCRVLQKKRKKKKSSADGETNYLLI